jgi:2-methylcitrate dehydratase PrpD
VKQAIDHLLDIAALPSSTISARARRHAEFSLFDWLVCARAGASEPVSVMMRRFLESEGGTSMATVVGSRKKLPARSAALANGTISHALDYDDTHFAHIGHLSVGIYPAALAVGEQVGASANDVRDAFVLGAEAACRLGMVLGRVHYQVGFHQTATAGAFGATIAAGRLYGLNTQQMRNALSLVATRASGLKSQFGTMGKPMNAGIAAANGVEAAGLARLGFVSADDGVSGAQGFIETHSDRPDHVSPWVNPPPKSFVFDDVKYKLHACCHGTHAMIEAIKAAQQQKAFTADDIKRIIVVTHPRWLKVCDIKQPRTGLEVKFSYVHLAAMIINHIDTSTDKTFTDSLAADVDLMALAKKVDIETNEALNDTTAQVKIAQSSGAIIQVSHDLSDPIADEVLERGLRAKAKGLLGPTTAKKIWSTVMKIETVSARGIGKLLAQ